MNKFPIKIGQTVYKICPKCNSIHNESCEHCPWRGCYTCCIVGVGVCRDGSCNTDELQIVPYTVTDKRFIPILRKLNVMFFTNKKDALTAIAEYEEIRKTSTSSMRYSLYKEWEARRSISLIDLGIEEEINHEEKDC